MLNVSLIITDNVKAAKLLDLLQELPFVIINDCQETSLQETEQLAALIRKLTAHPKSSEGTVIGDFSDNNTVSIAKPIYQALKAEFGYETLKTFARKLAADLLPTHTLHFEVDEKRFYCQYANGFRCIYSLGKYAWTGRTSIIILHLMRCE